MLCDETTDTCTCLKSGDCDDGVFCNGSEIYNPGGVCGPGVDHRSLQEWDVTLYEALVSASEAGAFEGTWQPALGKRVQRILERAEVRATMEDVDAIHRAVESAMSMLASHLHPNGGPDAPVPTGLAGFE